MDFSSLLSGFELLTFALQMQLVHRNIVNNFKIKLICLS